MRYFLLVFILLFVAACKKDASPQNTNSNSNPIQCNFTYPPANCVSAMDTNLAYQVILGKWYLREQSDIFGLNGPTESYCVNDSLQTLNFLANRTVIINDSLIMPYSFVINSDDGYYYLSDVYTLSDTSNGCEYCTFGWALTICDSLFTMEAGPGECCIPFIPTSSVFARK